jgi:anti-anti-sigma factor
MADTPATSAIQVEKLPNAILVKLLVTDLTETHITAVRTEMAPVVAQSAGAPIIIDMSKIKFVPSLTLGILVKLSTEFRSRKQPLFLVSLQPVIRQVFSVTRLDKMFSIQESAQTALERIGEAAGA